MSIYRCAQCEEQKDQDIEQTYSNDTGSYCERCTDNMSDEEFKQQFPDEIL
jgi:predicted nucleic acid-binding Zn ribbon protein